MISEQIFNYFVDFIYKHTGITYPYAESYRLESRLNALCQVYQVSSIDELYQLYLSGISNDMKQKLLDIATNNETFFFRDTKPFLSFGKEVYSFLEKSDSDIIKIWSAASSSGQEAYSIVMSLIEYGQKKPEQIFIDASDISSEILLKARKALYSGLEVQRGLSTPLLLKYFKKTEDDCWQLSDSIKSRVNFFEFNLLLSSFVKQKYDVIFCRNVLIYQTVENKKKILKGIYDSLKPNGLLLMGAGESMIGMDNNLFKQVQLGQSYFYQKV